MWLSFKFRINADGNGSLKYTNVYNVNEWNKFSYETERTEEIIQFI